MNSRVFFFLFHNKFDFLFFFTLNEECQQVRCQLKWFKNRCRSNRGVIGKIIEAYNKHCSYLVNNPNKSIQISLEPYSNNNIFTLHSRFGTVVLSHTNTLMEVNYSITSTDKLYNYLKGIIQYYPVLSSN